jgi:hypothetical protein
LNLFDDGISLPAIGALEIAILEQFQRRMEVALVVIFFAERRSQGM